MIDDFRALSCFLGGIIAFMKPEISSPERSTLLSRRIPQANETKISGLLLGESSGLEGISMLLAPASTETKRLR